MAKPYLVMETNGHEFSRRRCLQTRRIGTPFRPFGNRKLVMRVTNYACGAGVTVRVMAELYEGLARGVAGADC
jgi:hypothetical protein